MKDDQAELYDELGDVGDVREVKRGRWQGFCFRRTRSGRILPYICWKGCTSAIQYNDIYSTASPAVLDASASYRCLWSVRVCVSVTTVSRVQKRLNRSTCCLGVADSHDWMREYKDEST